MKSTSLAGKLFGKNGSKTSSEVTGAPLLSNCVRVLFPNIFWLPVCLSVFQKREVLLCSTDRQCCPPPPTIPPPPPPPPPPQLHQPTVHHPSLLLGICTNTGFHFRWWMWPPSPLMSAATQFSCPWWVSQPHVPSLPHGEGGISGKEGVISGEEGGISGEIGGISVEEGGISGEEGGISGEIGGISGEEGGISGEEGGISGKEGGISGEEGGISGEEGGISGEEGGISGKEGGISGEVGGISGEEGGISEVPALWFVPIGHMGRLERAPAMNSWRLHTYAQGRKTRHPHLKHLRWWATVTSTLSICAHTQLSHAFSSLVLFAPYAHAKQTASGANGFRWYSQCKQLQMIQSGWGKSCHTLHWWWIKQTLMMKNSLA